MIRAARGIAVSIVLAGCGGRAEVAPPPELPRSIAEVVVDDPEIAAIPGRRPTPPEQRAIRALMRVAERTRALTFERAVPFRIQSREVITQFVRDQIDAEELERSRIFYAALGLLEPALDIHDVLVRVLGEQIVGYYDPERGLMVIREDVALELRQRSSFDRELGEAEMVIVHELVHALQDQRLRLGERYEEERTIDAENAFASLVEGDATLAMIGHLASRAGRPLSALTQNTDTLRMLVRGNPSAMSGDEMERAPPIVRLPLLSRYLDGLLLCATLHGREGWSAVDRAHAEGPASTEQVLHPERYLAGDRPDAIELPELPSLAAAGYAPHEEDTLGELEMGIYFGLGSPAERDEAAAAGWGGDRLRVYRHPDGRTAVVWFTTWDDEAQAREAEAAAALVAGAGAPGAHHVERDGRAVLIVRDLPADETLAIRAAFARFAAALPPRAEARTMLDAQ